MYIQGHCSTHTGSLSQNFRVSLTQYTVTTSDLSVTQHNNVLSLLHELVKTQTQGKI